MAAVTTSKLASMILFVALGISSGSSAFFYQQQSYQASRAASLNDQNSSLSAQIASLNKQIDTLNGQISQLNALNTQLGGNNAQLASQITQLQSQVSQLQAQVAQLQAQLSLQQSRVIANQVTLYRSSFGNGYPVVSFVNLGSITYSGYLRVSWVATVRITFSVQVFDVNATTLTATSGVFNLPVGGANATSNAWFTCYDFYTVSGGNVCAGPDSGVMTYSMTYWF